MLKLRLTGFSLLCVGVMVSILGCKTEAQVQAERAAAERAQAEAESAQAARIENMPAQKAGVGVGAQGRSLDDVGSNTPGGIIAAPAKAYFAVRERVVFEIQIPQMLNLYNATNGRMPKSHEEFMKEVEANKIVLPKLPEGRVYRFRPDEGELYVESAKDPASQN
jgi:hypothetical protein